MRSRTVVLALAAVGTLASGWLAGQASAQAVPAAQRAPELIYAGNCGYCHGHNVGPIIRGRNLPAPMVEYLVRSGRGAMPAFKPSEISPAELASLARWISTSASDPREHGR
jgi:mono/diheme cytochrome c family protein